MRYAQLIVVTGALLGVAPGLAAQQAHVQRADAGSKDAAKMARRTVQPDLVAHCQNILRLQNSALEAATRTQRLSQAQPLRRSVVQAQAETSRSDLKSLLKELDATEAQATSDQKALIATLLVDDRQAAQHADQMVTTAQSSSSKGSDIATHASAVIQNVKQAQYALKTDPNSGLPNGRRETVLCASQTPAMRRMTGKPAPTPSTGQASGKRQY